MFSGALHAVPPWLAVLLALFAGFSFLLERARQSERANSVFAPWAMFLVCFAVAPLWRWGESRVGVFAAAIALLLAWNAATRDREIVVAPSFGDVQRILLLLCAPLGAFSPVFLVVASFLLHVRFRVAEHHATLPLRLLIAVLSFALGDLLCAAFALEGRPALLAALMWLLVTVLVSHYLIAGLAKTLLGPRPWSWMLKNRLHYLAASAYSWGWARFVPWGMWLRIIGVLRVVEVPLQVLILTAELLSPLALLDARIAVAFFALFAFFHVGVFLLSGLLFWDWIGSNLLLAWLVGSLAPDQTLEFGPGALAVCALVLVVFPLRQRLWKPLPLAWFDSPFTQRMVYSVVGRSGREYGLYSDFMCPHERLYGRVNGRFLSEDRFLTYHLGEVWRLEVRDAIVQAGANPAALDCVKERYGISAASKELAERHFRYLNVFFVRLNAGAKKQILPRSLAFLKAPGDQIYYFGDKVPYCRQEPVREVSVLYREEYFDGRRLVRLVDTSVASISVSAVDPDSMVLAELTPRELDVFLLRLAQGRLIHLPASLVP